MNEQSQEFTVVGKTELVNSPAEMIRAAVSSGANLDQLKKLLSLQERYDANEAKKAYNKAMAEFKANPPKIDKDKKVGYSSKAGGNVKYSHASLYNVVDKITVELSKHGFSASWKTQQNGKIIVTCRITHSLGHSEETSLSADADTSGAKNAIQAIGSTISYLERYTLLAATGLATYDQDNDGIVEEPKVDENKIKILKDLLASLQVDEAKFLEYMEVEKVEDIPASQYSKAKIALEAKKKGKEAK